MGTSRWMAHICFVNSQVGWASGDHGTIRKTMDGGKTWTGQTSGTTYNLSSIYFIDTLMGWAVGGLYDTTHSVIVKTTDGGATWVSLPFPDEMFRGGFVVVWRQH